MRSGRRATVRSIPGFLAALVAVLAGCASPGTAPSAPQVVFYPPAPAVPRIQHLARLSSARDLGTPRGGFATFIAGKEGKGQGLMQPYGVAAYGPRIYVVDSKAGGLAVFDLQERSVSLMTGAAGGRMKTPINVTIDRDGTKYVTDTGRNRVLVYSHDDRFVRALGTEGQFRPVDVAVKGERLYVVDIEHHQVQVLDKRSGERLFTFGQPGSKLGELFHPTNIAIAAGGDVFVTETGNYRVQRFTADGKPLRLYGTAGTAPGSFARPKGIALDRAGRMYVVDAAFQNVQIFDETGKLLMDFGRPQEGVEGLSLPAAVKIDYEHVERFRQYAAPGFDIEYLVFVVSQYDPTKLDVFGFGSLGGGTPAGDGKRAVEATK